MYLSSVKTRDGSFFGLFWSLLGPGTHDSAWHVGGAWHVRLADGLSLPVHGYGMATGHWERSILQVTEPSGPLSSTGR